MPVQDEERPRRVPVLRGPATWRAGCRRHRDAGDSPARRRHLRRRRLQEDHNRRRRIRPPQRREQVRGFLRRHAVGRR